MKNTVLILVVCVSLVGVTRDVHAQFLAGPGFDLNRPIQAAGENAYPWRNAPISYLADKATVTRVVTDFASQLGVAAEVSPALLGIVSGKLHAATPQAFLEQLAAAHPFDWYLLDGVLHASSYGERIRSTPTAATRADTGKLLERLGAAGKLLVITDLPRQQIAVSGPPALVLAFGKELAEPAGMQETGEPSDFFFFPLRHANVQDRVITRRNEKIAIPGAASILRQLVSGMYPPPAGEEAVRSPAVPASAVAIVADTRLNALAIRAPKHLLPTYRRLIEQLDVAVPLIQLEVTIVDIDSSLEDELGIDWSLSSGKSKIGVGNPERTGAAAAAARQEIGISTILGDRFAFLARINALKQDGKAEVVSRPSILTLNNATALLDLSETFYILNKGDRAVETTPVTTGLMLFVTPRVIPGATEDETAKVAMQIDIEDGKSTSREVAGIPVTKNSSISTQAMVGDHQSLLLAGHHLKESNSETSRIPGLSSIPLLGRLFQFTSESRIDRKRFFLITPRIVSETESGAS